LLHFLDDKTFSQANKTTFLHRFGNIKGSEQVDELHKVIRPYVVRLAGRALSATLTRIPHRACAVPPVDTPSGSCCVA